MSDNKHFGRTQKLAHGDEKDFTQKHTVPAPEEFVGPPAPEPAPEPADPVNEGEAFEVDEEFEDIDEVDEDDEEPVE